MSNVIVLGRTEVTADRLATEAEMAFCPKASMQAFAAWLVEVGQVEGLTDRQLASLHLEYCEIHWRKPMTNRARQNAYERAGIIKGPLLQRPGRRPKKRRVDRIQTYKVKREEALLRAA